MEVARREGRAPDDVVSREGDEGVMGWFIGAVLAGVLVWRLVRSRRLDVRAGLVAERPTFSVEPPTRRVGRRKGMRL